MSSERIPQFSTSTQLVFQDETLRFNCHQPPTPAPQRHVGDPGFIEDRYFSAQKGAELRRPSTVLGCDTSERRDQPRSDDDDDYEDVDEEDEVGGFVDGVDKTDGPSREVMMKDGNPGQSVSNPRGGTNEGRQEGRLDGGYNSFTIADHDAGLYYSQFVQGAEGSGSVQKNVGTESSGGVSGRKDSASYSNESGESLRAILSDPITGALMDDAMILPCGHSFGSAGIQHIIRMKACHTCSKTVSEDQITPNLSLRVAVQAFRREEESQSYRSSKRRRDRLEQDKVSYGDLSSGDPLRVRGAQFPFAVTDRVIIKGNKRTPERFVGREAVVTTQCLNGWYVVKTLDNAESVKLQYRSLAKVPDDRSIVKDEVKQTGSHLALDF